MFSAFLCGFRIEFIFAIFENSIFSPLAYGHKSNGMKVSLSMFSQALLKQIEEAFVY